jgi:hypothetical protein
MDKERLHSSLWYQTSSRCGQRFHRSTTSKRQAASRPEQQVDLGRLFGGWKEMRTHGVVVIVAEGVGKTSMGATVGLGGYEKE